MIGVTVGHGNIVRSMGSGYREHISLRSTKPTVSRQEAEKKAGAWLGESPTKNEESGRIAETGL